MGKIQLSAQRKREIQHEMEEARSWYSADQALPEFEAMLEYLVGREAQCRSWFGDGPGSYDFVVWDLRNVVAHLRDAARDDRRFVLEIA